MWNLTTEKQHIHSLRVNRSLMDILYPILSFLLSNHIVIFAHNSELYSDEPLQQYKISETKNTISSGNQTDKPVRGFRYGNFL